MEKDLLSNAMKEQTDPQYETGNRKDDNQSDGRKDENNGLLDEDGKLGDTAGSRVEETVRVASAGDSTRAQYLERITAEEFIPSQPNNLIILESTAAKTLHQENLQLRNEIQAMRITAVQLTEENSNLARANNVLASENRKLEEMTNENILLRAENSNLREEVRKNSSLYEENQTLRKNLRVSIISIRFNQY